MPGLDSADEELPVILLVDDSPANLQMLAACLKDNYHLKVTTSGKKAIGLVKQEPIPALVLLDIEMPEISGFEVCDAIKSDPLSSSIPVIFVTGKDAAMDEEAGFKRGAVDYITKPFNPSIVQARVKTHVTLKMQQDKMTFLALHDQLTGLYNRHYLLEVARQKVADSHRHGTGLSIIMLDVDHFKSVNDTHGHLVGDQVLKEFSNILQDQSRLGDVVTRFGGEEFLVLLNECDLERAMQKAEAIRNAFEEAKPYGITVTASFGVGSLNADSETFEDLLRRTDAAAYAAKTNGRNRVEASNV